MENKEKQENTTMKMKKFPALLLCGAVLASALTGCSGSGESSKTTADSAETVKTPVKKIHTLNIRAPKDISEITATFMNTSNGKTEDVKMKKSGGDEKNTVFCCDGDVTKYNMVHLTYGEKTSMDVAFNSFISGWNLENNLLLPYVVGTEPVYDPEFETKTFQFDGRDKKVYIWTPADYDEKSEEKYINDFVLPLADSLFFSYISKTNTNGEGIKTSHRWYDTALNSKANISDSNRKKAELLDKIAKNYGDVGTIPTGSTDITYNGRQYWDDLVSLIDPNMVKESNILITLRMYNFVASEMYKGVSKYWKTSSITEEEYKAAFEKLKAETDKLTQSGDYKVNEGMLSVYVKSIDDFYQKAEREGLGTTNTSQEGSGK